ncbi:MAG: Malonyl CoA-acyl carrier protein transacylase, partial [Pedosphaera sp.]|nr:Malonyl CoA-acyl carrier protein transacylase [Pedosphaera sp.]
MIKEFSTASTSASNTPGTDDSEGFQTFPVSFAQQRLWLLDRLEPGSSVYNVPAPARLRGRLDVEALRRALNEIVRRHEPLRTTFAAAEDAPVQVITPEARLEVPLIDLSHLPESAREAEAMRLLQEDARKPFDLTKDLMLRAGLLRLGPEEHLLMMTMHHIASDGWSIGVFYRELQILHEAFSHGRPSPLPDFAIQYADFGVWQRQWLQGAVLERQLDYWKRQLAGAPGLLELPLDHPRPPSQTYRGGMWQEISFDKKIVEQFKALCRAEGCTLFMGLLAAFEAVVFRYTGQSDVV